MPFNPFTPTISIFILITACHTLFIMLVLRIYSHYLAAWHCHDIKCKKKLSVGSEFGCGFFKFSCLKKNHTTEQYPKKTTTGLSKQFTIVRTGLQYKNSRLDGLIKNWSRLNRTSGLLVPNMTFLASTSSLSMPKLGVNSIQASFSLVTTID